MFFVVRQLNPASPALRVAEAGFAPRAVRQRLCSSLPLARGIGRVTISRGRTAAFGRKSLLRDMARLFVHECFVYLRGRICY